MATRSSYSSLIDRREFVGASVLTLADAASATSAEQSGALIKLALRPTRYSRSGAWSATERKSAREYWRRGSPLGHSSRQGASVGKPSAIALCSLIFFSPYRSTVSLSQ